MKKCIALILVLMMFALTACGDNVKKTNESTQNDNTANEDATYVISAGGLDLKYPAKWQDKVAVTVEDDRACFTCGDTKLFDLLFNRNEGNLIGTVKGEKYIVICVVDYSIESEDPKLLTMKDDVNVILDNLNKDYDFVTGVALEKEDTSTFDIKTSVTTMKYPAKWQDKVTVDVSEDKVVFSAEGTPLFDLVFVDCDGYLLGTYKNTPIYIVDYDVVTDEQISMQDDVNVILEHLMEDSNFVINH